MATPIESQISTSQVESLLKGDQNFFGYPSSNLKIIYANDPVYKFVQKTVEERLLKCPHSFQLSKVEIIPAPISNSVKFQSALGNPTTSRPNFLFHGTNETNHQSIFNNGFSLDDNHFGDTDKGYIGKGVYLSSFPEYCAAYIKKTPGITRYAYYEPVQVGVTCKLLGCIALNGRTRQLYQKDYGTEIESNLESRWAWVDKQGDVTTNSLTFFAQEYAIKEPVKVYPRFRISLTRVTKEVVWVDPNIGNAENSRYVAELKVESGISLYATSSSDKALAALKKRKEGTLYRAITAGRGGEEFVRSLRSAGIHCKVMVFCGTVAYHKEWAKKFSNVEVTNSTETFKKYATWKY